MSRLRRFRTADVRPAARVRRPGPQTRWGCFPRHLQTWFVAGDGRPDGAGRPADRPTTAATHAGLRARSPRADDVDPNQVRIQEYRDRIDEQVRRLAGGAGGPRGHETGARRRAGRRRLRPPSQRGGPTAHQRAGSAQATLEQDQAPARRTGRSMPTISPWTSGQRESGPSTKTDGRERSPRVCAARAERLRRLTPALTSALAAAFAASTGQTPPSAKPERQLAAPARRRRPPRTPATASRPPQSAAPPDRESSYPASRGHHHRDGADQSARRVLRRARELPGHDAGLRRRLPARADSRGSRVLGRPAPVTQFDQQRLAVAFHRLHLPERTHGESRHASGPESDAATPG